MWPFKTSLALYGETVNFISESGRRVEGAEMNAFQLLLFLLGVVLTFVMGSYLVRYVGWWGILPAGILGFGSVVLLILVLNRVILHRPPDDTQNSDQN